MSAFNLSLKLTTFEERLIFACQKSLLCKSQLCSDLNRSLVQWDGRLHYVGKVLWATYYLRICRPLPSKWQLDDNLITSSKSTSRIHEKLEIRKSSVNLILIEWLNISWVSDTWDTNSRWISLIPVVQCLVPFVIDSDIPGTCVACNPWILESI